MAATQEETTRTASLSGDSAASNALQAIFVLSTLGVGGSETKTIRLANSLFARGVRVALAYLNAPHTLLPQLRGDIPVWHLARKGKFSLSATATLRALIREHRPRTVVAVNLYPALYVAVATAGLPVRPRTVGLVNTSVFRPGERWQQGFYRPVLRMLDWSVYGCEAQRSQWLSGWTSGRGSMVQRSCVIYNGVDAERFGSSHSYDVQEQRSRYGIAGHTYVVGTVGRLAPEKNQLALIDALACVRATGVDMHLLLVGDGPMRPALEARAAQLRLQTSITFTGGLADVREALALMDVFVLPSSSVETFSNAALEAMAMRKPVILTRTGGACEMICDGVDGFIVTIDELAARLPALLTELYADAGQAGRVGLAAAARVAQSFSWDGMVDRYQALLLSPEGTAHA